MAYEIEKSVPVPPSRRGGLKYPFPDMEVGDSFFVSGSAPANKIPAVRSAHAYGSRHDRRFATRQVDGGIRIWRVE